MLDIRLIRERPELVRQAALDKGVVVDLDRFLDLDRRHRILLLERDTLLRQRRAVGRRIAELGGLRN